MDGSSFQAEKAGLQTALADMETALSILDDAGAPHEIGAYLDLAICRLRDEIAECPYSVRNNEAAAARG